MVEIGVFDDTRPGDGDLELFGGDWERL